MMALRVAYEDAQVANCMLKRLRGRVSEVEFAMDGIYQAKDQSEESVLKVR